MKNTDKPLRISFVYDDSLDGNEGVAQYVKTLGSWMTRRGHEVSYLVGETKLKEFEGGKVYSLAKNVKTTFNGNKMSIPMPASVPGVKRALRSADPQVLHVQMPHSPFMAQKIINAVPHTAAMGTFHIYPAGLIARHGTRALKLAYLGGLKKVDKIVSVSLAAQRFAKEAFGIDTEVVPNVVDVAGFRSDVKNKPNRIVFLGRLVKRKGCRQLIEAFALAGSELPEAELIVAGKGPETDSLQKLCMKLGIAERVKFLGFIEESEKADLLASARVACFPSLYGESFGIVLIEAMAAGSGVVLAGNNPGYASVMADQPELLFNPKDTQTFAHCLVKFMKDEPSAAKIHSWQTEHVKKFDVENVGPYIENIYRELIANKNKKRHN